MANIIASDSIQSPQAIYNANNYASERNCPWVQIGNLFVSLTFTGNKSWKPVVEHEHEMGYREFTILSGRHGDQYGQLVQFSTGEFGPGVAEPTHYTQDLAEKDDLDERLDDLHLQVIDVGRPPYNTLKALKALALAELIFSLSVAQRSWVMQRFSSWQFSLPPHWVASSGSSTAVTMSATEISTGTRARLYPPPGPRTLDTSLCRRSLPNSCSR